MQGNFYGAFQGKKKDMLPLLSKLGADRQNRNTITGLIFNDIELPENWPEMSGEDWVTVRYSSGGSMTINYLEGPIFSDLKDYLLKIEAITCTFAMDYGNAKTYTYSPYDSLEIRSARRKTELQSAARDFEKTTGQTSVTRGQQDWGDYYHGNAGQFIPDEVLPPVVYDESDFLIRKGVLMQYTGSAEEITIPDECTAIGDRAFQKNETLKRVVIPGNVRKIGDSAFYGCKTLEEVELNKGLKEIGAYAFLYTALKRAYLPDGLTKLGLGAFNKVALRIPASLKSLGEDSIFSSSPSELMTEVEVAEDHPVYASKNGCLFRKTDGILLTAPKDLTGVVEIPEGVKKIGAKLFWCNRELTGVRIPEGVTEIGEDAFGGCHALAEVELPESLVEIGSSAFSVCRSLTSLTLPKGLKRIGHFAFRDCKALKRLDIPDGLEHLGGTSCVNGIREAAFGEKTTVLAADLCVEPVRSLLGFHPVELRLTPGRDYTGMVTPIVLEYLVEQNDPEMFAIAEPLAPELWDWLPDLLRHAQHCGAERMEARLLELEEAGLASGKKRKPLTAAQWKKLWLFKDNKDGTYTAKGYRGPFSHAVLPETLGKFTVTQFIDGNDTFSDKFTHSTLRTLTLPAGLDSISIYFGLMPNLERIEVSGDGTFSSQDGILYRGKQAKTMIRCPLNWNGTRCVVPKGVTTIGRGAFRDCNHLTEIELPQGLEKIESEAFEGCSSLTSLTIPEGTQEIGSFVFNRCHALKELTIPASVTKIDENALGSSYARCSDFVLRAPAGSCAAQFAVKNAEENKITFEAL